MRIDTHSWSVSAASHIGHYHDDRGENCQDAFAISTFDDWIVGVVCDGCGGSDIETNCGVLKGKPEVASALLSDFSVRQLRRYLSFQSNKLSTQTALAYLFDDINSYIRSCINYGTSTDTAIIVKQFWLSTILGFVMNPEFGFVFYSGDGVVSLDDELWDIDQDDTPKYIAYNCIRNPEQAGVPKELLSDRFDTLFFDPTKIERFMIATDGFTNHNLHSLSLTRESGVNVPDSLQGEQWNKKGKTGLKRWLNVKYAQGYFHDDTTLITVESRR